MKLTINLYIKSFLLISLIFLINTHVWGKDDLKSLTTYLDQIIDNKEEFTEQKEQKIASLKQLLKGNNSSLEYQFEINSKLGEEYKKFILDSAIHYVEKNMQIADNLQSTKLINSSAIQLAALYSYSGMYRESEEILKSIDSGQLPREQLSEYYQAYCLFLTHYAAANSPRNYSQEYDNYTDSLMSVLDKGSYSYRIIMVRKYMNRGEMEEAENLLLDLLEEQEVDSPNYAVITYYLGSINGTKGDPDLEKKYYILSAIADIKNSTKENASFRALATIYYEADDITKAFKYAQSAIEDAVFCNVQFRTAQLSKFYSIINAANQAKEAKANSQLKLYLILISILSIFLILLVVYIYKQMKYLSNMKEELSTTNDKLTLLNNEINERNTQLSEANHVKEQYIAHFFDLCSTYINKMEDYRINLTKLALNNQFDKLLKALKSTSMVDNEIEDLYKNFDSIFLSIYPTFVSDFNSLLIPEEQITLKSDDLLNKELRIYALLRLGITDSAKIAGFLRCSLSTVYNYRTKIRNKTVVPRDEFEDIIMKIGVLHKESN
ncbi:MAG: DUF6377 domain-containing protein [Prevotella sp.]|nr:DUF6377 domain-containing protein [Prevotella sp.]